MLDPRLFRTQLEYVEAQLARRGFVLDSDTFRVLETRRREVQIKTQALQNERNTRSKQIGQAKARGETIQPLLDTMQHVGEELNRCENELEHIQNELERLLLDIPNLLDQEVPDGKSDIDNQEVYCWGELPSFCFTPKDHVELGAQLGGMDFDAASRLTGARFVVLTGSLARLQRALTQFMLDLHVTQHGYTEVYVPFMVNADSMRGTGQLPKFEADLFKVEHLPPFYLIPTAEVPVTNLVRDSIIESNALPLRFVCHTPCFRSEAGSYGKDVRGMIRQHQFEKVELVQITTPEASGRAHEELTEHAETVLKQLRLPFRRVILCSGDTGFSSAKTYDIEVWLPGQGAYREISSCSNFRDFQARRLRARWRNTGKPELLHTLNGSGLAVGRTLIAVLENYQDANGHVHIPEVLVPYMGGVEVLS